MEELKRIAQEVLAIRSTLEELDIKPTAYNMDRLLGCQQYLLRIHDDLQKMIAAEEKNDADNNAE